jgi:hypothetical protein
MVNNPAEIQLLFLLGPSGAGKSQVGAWLAADLNFLHIEIDRCPEGDGIDLTHIRPEWDAFLDRNDAGPLAKTLSSRVMETGRTGVVLTFTSLVVFNQPRIEQLRTKGISVIILYGSESECLNSFLDREKRLARGMENNERHWIYYNRETHAEFSRPEYAPWRLTVFKDGVHRSRIDIVNEIQRSIANKKRESAPNVCDAWKMLNTSPYTA